MADTEEGSGGREPEKSPFGRLFRIASSIVIAPLLLFALSFMPSCMGFGEPALAAVNACPAAVAALGSPITQPWIGLSCGSAETEDDDGRASWSMPVSGPRGRGSLDIRAAERSGRWQFGALVLTVGGRTIDVLGCAAGGSADGVTHRELHGTVTTIVGQPGVTNGQACTVTIDPSEGAQSCRVGVVCGSRTLYGGGTQGYGHCGVDASGAIVLRDGNPSTVDGDPMLDLRVGANEVVVTDQGNAGTWVVTVTTTP